MAKQRISFTLAAVIVFFVILLALVSIRFTGVGNSFPNPVGGLMRDTLAPLQSGVMSFTTGVRNTVAGIWEFRKTKQENEQLKAKVEEVSKENIQLKQKILAGMRYEELEKKFDPPTIWKKKYIGATVINRNPSNWYNTIVLNRGTDNGIQINDPVITNVGLVGKVISVSSTTAEVVLILDTEGQVSGTVRQSDGTPSSGIVIGNYKRGSIGSPGIMKMSVPKDDKVNPGDLVLTSGLGGVYPSEIPIGTVQSVNLETGGLLKTAVIVPLVQFDHLEEVFVVLGGGK